MKNSDRLYIAISAFVIAAAFFWFGGGLVCHLWKTEVGKAAMKIRVEDVLDPAERLFVLERIHDVLKSRHKSDPQLWEMTLVDLINRPGTEFNLTPTELGLIRRLYMKFRITKTEV